MGVHIKTVSINGQDFEIKVDEKGTFNAIFDGERLEQKTLEALTEQLTKVTRTKSKPVNFCRMIGNKTNGYTLVDGVITKRNIRTGNLMVKINGKTEQEYTRSSHPDRMYMRPLLPDEILVYNNLYAKLQAAQNAIEHFEESRTLDIKQALGEEK